MKHHIEQPPRFDVAVLYPGTSGLVREIVRGILSASEETDPEHYLRCSYFVASEHKENELRHTLAELVNAQPHLIISVGYAHTKALIAYLHEHSCTDIPLICTATDGLTISVKVDPAKEALQREARAHSKKPLLFEDPVIVKHMHTLVSDYPGPSMALERGNIDQQQMLRSLMTLQPRTQRIMVPFVDDECGWGQRTFDALQRTAALLPNPEWEEREKRHNKEMQRALHDGDDAAYEELKQAFDLQRRKEKEQYNETPYCTLLPLAVAQTNITCLPRMLDEALKQDGHIDAVIALEEFALGDVMRPLMKVCTQHTVLLFGGSSAAVYSGAVAGFGGSYTTLGAECFVAAYDHLVKKKNLKIHCSRHIAITREPLCNVARCRALAIKEHALQNFLHLPRITTIESS